MKILKAVSAHGATAIAVMCTVFLCINFVNEAMAFYDHLFTKLLLFLLSLLLCLNSHFLRRQNLLPRYLLPPCLLLSAGEAAICLIALWDPSFFLFLSLFGQTLSLCLCLLSLSVSLSLTVSIEKERSN